MKVLIRLMRQIARYNYPTYSGLFAPLIATPICFNFSTVFWGNCYPFFYYIIFIKFDVQYMNTLQLLNKNSTDYKHIYLHEHNKNHQSLL